MLSFDINFDTVGLLGQLVENFSVFESVSILHRKNSNVNSFTVDCFFNIIKTKNPVAQVFCPTAFSYFLLPIK